MPSDLPFDLYSQALTHKTSSLDQIDAAQMTASPDFAWRIASIGTLWPDIHPTVAVPLAQQGFDGYSPEVQQVAQVAVKQAALGSEIQRSLGNVETLGDFNQKYGHLTSDEYKALSPKQQHELHQKAQSLAAQKLADIGGGGGFLGTGVGPGVSHDDVVEKIKSAERTQAKGEGGAVGGAEAVTRKTSKNAPALDPAQFTYAGQLDKAGETASNLPGIGGAVAPVVRTAGLVANAPLQAVQGGIREFVAGVNSLASGTYNPNPAQSSTQSSIAEQTQLGQSLKALEEGRNVDVGSGYLPDANSATGQAAAEAARRAAPTINGHAWTLGRFTAEQAGIAINEQFGTHVLEPDSESYALMSGLIDAGVALKGDPTAGALSAVGEGRAAARTFSPATATAEAAASAGTVDAAALIRRNSGAVGARALGKSEEAWNDLLASDREAFLDEVERVHGASVRHDVAQDLAEQEGAGLIPTTSRNFVDQNRKVDYLASPRAEAVFSDYHAKYADNPAGMMRASNWTLRAETVNGQPLAVQMADAANTDEMRSAYAAATDVQNPLQKLGVTYKLRQAASEVRALHAMPTGLVDLTDKNSAVKVLDDAMAGARVPEAARDAALNTYLRSADPLAGVDAVQEAIKNMLTYYKPEIDPKKATQLSTFFRNADNHLSAFDIDQATGVERIRPGIGISGEAFVEPAPSLSSESWNGTANVPDMRTLRRMTSNFSHITGTGPWAVSQTALAAPAMIWKPFALLSARLMVRFFGEVQLNEATRGNVSAITDFPNYVGSIIGANIDKKVADLLPMADYTRNLPGFRTPMASFEKIPGVDAKWLLTAEGKGLMEDVRGELGRASALVHDPDVIATKNYLNVSIAHPNAHYGVAETLAHMNLDPIWRGVAEAESPAAAKEWFWSGEGAKLRLQKYFTTSIQDQHGAENLASGKWSRYFPIGDIANDRAAADRYIDEVVQPQIRDVTGGNSELMDAIRTGKLGGVDIYNVSGGRGLSAIDRRAADRAAELLADGEGPRTSVRLPQDIYKSGLDVTKAAAYTKTAVDHLFYWLMDAPDRLLNRNVAYQQEYWKEVEKLVPYLEPGEYDKVLSVAERAGLPKEQLARITSTPLDGTATERLTQAQLHQVAKGNALDNIKNIVHDYGQKSQFFDMTRAVIPFGDAFRLIARRWIKTLAENPQGIRRLQQGIQAAREPGSAAVSKLFGDPVPQGDGFFHTDPTTGDEVFTFPGSTWLDKSLIGVPLSLTGKVSGLSMVGAGYPGLGGPAVTIPAKWFLPSTPQYDGIRKLIFPYGETEGKGVAGDIAGEFEPAWFAKLVGDQPDQKTFNNTVKSMLAMLDSSGDYKVHGPKAAQETLRLLQDATDSAGWAYIVRGAAQFFSPTAPTFEPQVHDKSGRLTALATLSQKFNEKQQKLGSDGAMEWLLTHFGTKNLFVAQPGSQPTAYGVPVTAKAEDWATNHPAVKSKYPDTYGLFAPQGGEFDITTYEAQFERGERVTLSGAQQVAQAQQRLGYYAYNHARDQMLTMNQGKALTQSQTLWLSDYKKELEGEFPGFNTFLASPYDSQKKLTNALGQLEAASKDPALKHTDAGEGLTAYLDAREQAIATAQQKWNLKSPFQANKAEPLRNWLRDAADEIIKDHPGFAPIWEQVYSHELKVDMKQGS